MKKEKRGERFAAARGPIIRAARAFRSVSGTGQASVLSPPGSGAWGSSIALLFFFSLFRIELRWASCSFE
jgi:hypothetical protein